MIQRLTELYNQGGMREVKRGIRDYILVNSSIPFHALITTKKIQVPGVTSRIHIKRNTDILRTKAHAEDDILADYRERIAEDTNPVVWDIGANIGVYSLIAAEKEATVCAFEPGEKARNELFSNLQLNSLYENVQILEYALSDYTGTARLSKEDRSGTRSLGEQGDKIVVDRGDKINCDTPDILKIDVEGHELKVLDGMQETLPSINTVYIEVHENHGIKKLDVYRRMWDSGFELTDEWNPRDGTPHMRFDREGGS